MSYWLVYGLREARALIVEERRAIAAAHHRSANPYVRGQRDALKALDEKIKAQLANCKLVSKPPASVAATPEA